MVDSPLQQLPNSARKRKKLSFGKQSEYLDQTPPKGEGNSQDRVYPSDYCFMKKNYQNALGKIYKLDLRVEAAERENAMLLRERGTLLEDIDVLEEEVKMLGHENECLTKRLGLVESEGSIEKISVKSEESLVSSGNQFSDGGGDESSEESTLQDSVRTRTDARAKVSE